jgi:hypothetical protein
VEMQKTRKIGRSKLSKGQAEGKIVSLLLEGLASGEHIPLTNEFWRELNADAARLLQQRKPAKKSRTRQ